MASSRGAAARNGSVPSVVTCSSPRVRSAKAAARASTSAPDSSTRRRAVRRLASWARSWRLAGSRRPVQARRASHAPCTGAARTATVTTTPTGSRSFRARGRTQAAAAIPAAPRGAAGIAAAAWVVPGALNDLLPVGVVVTVAVLAAPVQGAWLARRAWTGRREPANRQDRAQLAKRRTVRRLVLESGALVLALAAAFALRTRGLLQVTTEGTDPFLAAAPLLLAIAVTVLLLRVYPWPIRAVGVLGRRTRGVLGLLGAVRAQRAVAVLPLLALTLGAAVAVAGGLLVDTVRTGQVEASWERVGADIRVDAELTRDQVAAIAEQPGVTAVGSAHVAKLCHVGRAHRRDTRLLSDRRDLVPGQLGVDPDVGTHPFPGGLDLPGPDGVDQQAAGDGDRRAERQREQGQDGDGPLRPDRPQQPQDATGPPPQDPDHPDRPRVDAQQQDGDGDGEQQGGRGEERIGALGRHLQQPTGAQREGGGEGQHQRPRLEHQTAGGPSFGQLGTVLAVGRLATSGPGPPGEPRALNGRRKDRDRDHDAHRQQVVQGTRHHPGRRGDPRRTAEGGDRHRLGGAAGIAAAAWVVPGALN